MQRGSFQWMKSLNKTMILNTIRKKGPISRAQIAKETMLTPPTVSSIVKELMDQGIVRESFQGPSQGGRKPTLLVINHSEFFVVGIDAGPKNIVFILTDLSGQVVDQLFIEIAKPINKEQFLATLKKGIKQLIGKNNDPYIKLIGIGVAMHGVVDVTSGTSLFAPNLNLRNVPIKMELEEEFNLVVKVENDARAMALGEVWFGDSQDVTSMIAINIGRGIGAGIVVDGQLYHGEFDLAGEIGHMTIDMNGEKCECGNYGCLQTVSSGPAIVHLAVQAMNKGTPSLLSDMANGDLENLTGELIFEAACLGDVLAKRVLEDAGKYLGIGITNLIHILNPSKIVLGGGVSKANSFLLDTLHRTVLERALTEDAKNTEIVITKLGDYATVKGAVALLLVELFIENNQIIQKGK